MERRLPRGERQAGDGVDDDGTLCRGGIVQRSLTMISESVRTGVMDSSQQSAEPKPYAGSWYHTLRLVIKAAILSAHRTVAAVWPHVVSPLGVMMVAALASLLCGVFVAAQGFVVLAGVVAPVLLGLIWPWISIRAVRGTLQFRDVRAYAGDVVELELIAKNLGPWPIWGLEVDAGFHDAPSPQDQPDATLAYLPGWATSTVTLSVPTERRGRVPVRPPVLRTGFPFGFYRARRTITGCGDLIVWPAVLKLNKVVTPSHSLNWSCNTTEHLFGHHGERGAARPYRYGDSTRMIHWPLSARHDMFFVSERHRPIHPEILLEGWIGPNGAQDSGPEHALASRQTTQSVEWLIRILASCGESLWSGQDCPLTCRIGDVQCTIPGGRNGLKNFLDWLATFDSDRPTPSLYRRGSPGRRPSQAAGYVRIVVATATSWRLRLESNPDLAIVLDDVMFDQPTRNPSTGGTETDVPRADTAAAGSVERIDGDRSSARRLWIQSPDSAHQELEAGWRRWGQGARHG